MTPFLSVNLHIRPSDSELPRALWLSAAAASAHVVADDWATTVRQLPAKCPLLVGLHWAEPHGWDAYGRLEGAAVHLSWSEGHIHVLAAGGSPEACRTAIDVVQASFPRSAPEGNLLPITIWAWSDGYAQQHERSIEVPTWSDISANYAAGTHAELEWLMTLNRPESRGKLLLWHGLPGTGKTWAIRALGYEWREWCELHYISDPEVFLGDQPGYLLEVALARRKGECESRSRKWRLMVLEDAGELLTVDAKTRVGQALSRLLNLSDGILGQGAQLLVLITTNEELGNLHPAVQRPGRCLQIAAFQPFSSAESQAWLAQRGRHEAPGSRTLADLFGVLDGIASRPEQRAAGFARP